LNQLVKKNMKRSLEETGITQKINDQSVRINQFNSFKKLNQLVKKNMKRSLEETGITQKINDQSVRINQF
ncbi:hypothetical protein CEF12_17005, partial [Enterococcus faecalis]